MSIRDWLIITFVVAGVAITIPTILLMLIGGFALQGGSSIFAIVLLITISSSVLVVGVGFLMRFKLTVAVFFALLQVLVTLALALSIALDLVKGDAWVPLFLLPAPVLYLVGWIISKLLPNNVSKATT